MEKYAIHVSWTMTSLITVEANSPEEALNIAKNTMPDIPVPKENAYYLDDSFTIDEDDPDEISKINTYSPYSISEVEIQNNGTVTAN